MKVTSFRIFHGRNIYSHKKCVRLNLDLEGYSEIPSKEIYDFNESLVRILPELTKHRCRIDEDREFMKSISVGTYLAHMTERIIIALHNMIGVAVSYGTSREISRESYFVIYQYEYRNTAIEASNIAVDMVNSLINKQPFHLSLRVKRLKEILMNEQLGVCTLNICSEAKKRGIPILKIGDGSMFQLGYGKYSKVIKGTMDCNTSIIAVNILEDRLLTKQILSRLFLPVVRGVKVETKIDSILVAKDIGYPVVLKHQFAKEGKGVIANIKHEQQLSEAYEFLIKDCKDIIIEKYIGGKDYRVCIIYGDVVAVLEKIPPCIVGEVISSNISEKDELNLKGSTNLSAEEVVIDCTDLICEENIEICKRAASAIGLDICEVGLRCENICKPLNESGAIIEIYATPSIRVHQNPSIESTSNVAAHIVDKLFEKKHKNIPLIAVTGTNGKTTTTRLISHILSIEGYAVGMTTTGGIYIDGKCIFEGDTTGPKSALAVLMNKNVEAAVLETARGGIIREGLAYDLADVAVITNITEDHIGLDGVESIEDLAKVKALVGEAVKEDGYVVINGDDNMSITIMHRLKCNLIIFSNSKDNEIMQANIKNGGYGIYVEKGNIVIQNSSNLETLIDIKNIGITINGILKYNIENAMAACGAAVAIGIGYDVIRKGLSSFYCNKDQNPGRFNMYSINDVMVILDYGHNIDGYKRVIDGLKHLKHNKLIGIIGVPGDRTDSHILELGKCAGENFDYILIKENKDGRGRATGEVAELLEQGILRSKFERVNIKKVLKETEAFNIALDIAKPGDIVIIFFEKLQPLMDIISSKVEENKCEIKLLVKS